MPQSREPHSFETQVFKMLGDLQALVKELDTDFEKRIRTIEDARLTEAGFKSGATWLAKVIYGCVGGVGLLVFQAVMKHFGWL